MVVGARPNLVKMAPVILEARRRKLPQLVVHTGQHYDSAMSKVFFDELHMPEPDVYLGVGSGSHSEQTARVMMGFEKLMLERQPDLVLVAGDVNSTLACALVAAKLCVPVAHLEAGLRSFDRRMPEEINRVLTDHVSDLLLTSEPSGMTNLLREGIPRGRISFVGNCMIDSLRAHLEAALKKKAWEVLGLQPGEYGVITLHRPALVDDPRSLDGIRTMFAEIAKEIPLIFPVHPRTRKNIESSGKRWDGVRLSDPLGYLDFLGLMARARVVLTDSGGIQEETTALGIPCATLRENTERPVTVDEGTNMIAGTKPERILATFHTLLHRKNARAPVPALWDGRAAVRTVDVIGQWLGQRSRV
jgi:UDP-N-acetylglucosamine 2-epimerase (non-hydrolysing)